MAWLWAQSAANLSPRQFPDNQGIQGIFTKMGEFGPVIGGNPLETSGFQVNSLQNITGKFKTRTGTLMRGSGNLKIVSRRVV